MIEIHCDIAIIGASMGGCAAERAARQAGDTAPVIILTEATDWPGGQMTAQGVSAFDEHAYIEQGGCTRGYADLRTAIRQSYIKREGAPPVMAESVLGPNMPLNRGNGWVSRLCFLPARGLEVIQAGIASPTYLETEPVSAEVADGLVQSVTLTGADGTQYRVFARYFLDATDLGDLLPLTGTAYSTGSQASANDTQSFTMCFAVEYCPGEDHTLPEPADYARFRDAQPYTLAPLGRDGQPVTYNMFTTSDQGNPPFWTYRRIHDGALLGGRDISLINWVSNDYFGGNIIDVDAATRARYLDEARRLSLGFLRWLQTECPRDDGGFGYPELRLRPDVMGTADGLSKAPYIRESRRIDALETVEPADIVAEANDGARARHRWDSIGIGWYAMDLHPCVENPDTSVYAATRPFQIPLGALIPRDTRNLIAACKNIGTTHLTNGAYRLHPIEWAVGEAAGTLAAFCLAHETTPGVVHADPWQVWRLQARVVRQGCPITWAVDVPVDHAAFFATQLLMIRDIIVPGGDRWHSLAIGLNQPLGLSVDVAKLRGIAKELNQHAGRTLVRTADVQPDMTWVALCDLFQPALLSLL
ncbi:MAG: FAD-dependent oxidoreductase [Chloroflexota bacterium]